jgi:hypothetical protein
VAEHRDVKICQLIDGPAAFVERRRLIFGSTERAILSAGFDSRPTDFKRNVQPNTCTSVLVNKFAIRGFNPGATAECEHTCVAGG